MLVKIIITHVTVLARKIILILCYHQLVKQPNMHQQLGKITIFYFDGHFACRALSLDGEQIQDGQRGLIQELVQENHVLKSNNLGFYIYVQSNDASF